MSIPVYGLSGLDGILGSLGNDSSGHLRTTPGRSFNAYLSKIKNSAYRDTVIERHNAELAALNGIFTVSQQHIDDGTATEEDVANVKKVRILVNLDDTDYDGYRFAKEVMPYVIDVDGKDGSFLFPNIQLATIAADAEERYIKYLASPYCTEQGIEEQLGSLKSFFKKVGKVTANALKATGKAVVNSVVQPIKQTINATKATVQLVTGDAKGAWETFKQVLTEPIKVAWSDTKDVFKATVIDPTKVAYDVTKETIVVGGKVFKVIFLKINPVTAAIRASLRGLIAINFLGLATRLNVGTMTEDEAAAAGYDRDAWSKAKTGLNKAKNIFRYMGGNPSKLVKSIQHGASKKPLFSKDIRPDTSVVLASDDDEGESRLGEPATIAAMLAAAGSIISVLWSIVQYVIQRKDQQSAAQEEKERQAKIEEQTNKMREVYAYDPATGLFYRDENGNLVTWEEFNAAQTGTTGGNNNKRNILLAAGAGLLAFGAVVVLTSGGKKKNKKR